jgi:hypothetical protein
MTILVSLHTGGIQVNYMVSVTKCSYGKMLITQMIIIVDVKQINVIEMENITTNYVRC